MDQERFQAPPEEFRLFLRKKRRFLLSAGIFFISFYFLFPLLLSWFPEGVNRPVWGPFTWAWLYAFAHFPVVWILGVVYLRQAERWDRMAASQRRKDFSAEAPYAAGKQRLLLGDGIITQIFRNHVNG